MFFRDSSLSLLRHIDIRNINPLNTSLFLKILLNPLSPIWFCKYMSSQIINFVVKSEFINLLTKMLHLVPLSLLGPAGPYGHQQYVAHRACTGPMDRSPKGQANPERNGTGPLE